MYIFRLLLNYVLFDFDYFFSHSFSFLLYFGTCNYAFVSGPNQNDGYEDKRDDYIANEVATDYNAAWQGVLAGLIQYAWQQYLSN